QLGNTAPEAMILPSGATHVPVAVPVTPLVQPGPSGCSGSRPLLPAALSQPPEYQAQLTPRSDRALPILSLVSGGSRRAVGGAGGDGWGDGWVGVDPGAPPRV